MPAPSRHAARAVSETGVAHALVLGRYRVGPLIGHGATARVYRADDTQTGVPVALKEIVLQDGLARRVRSEIRAAARLDHDAIARLIDWGNEGETVYIAWELVDGPSLAECMEHGRPMHTGRVVSVIADVLDGLAHAHARGVIHRDVKPANILIGRDDRARLADFGVARLVDEAGSTRQGVTVGTMAYMAPEQATGRLADGAADVYAACLCLFEGLTGANPIASGNPAETARRAAAAAVPGLGEARPDLPRSLVRAITSGLSRDPLARPSAATLAASLRAAIRGGTPGSVGAPTSTAARRDRASALASGAGAAALTTSIVAVPFGLGIVPGLAAGLAACAGTTIAPSVAIPAVGALAAGAALSAAPATAVLAILVTIAVAIPARRHPRLLLLPLLAPLLAFAGMLPLYVLLASLLRTVRRRVWAVSVGLVALMSWQIWIGGVGLLASSSDVRSASAVLGGDGSLMIAIDRLTEPIRANPASLLGIPIVVLATLVAPRIRRRRRTERLAAGIAWLAAIVIALAIVPGVGGGSALALLPSVAVVGAWTTWPPRAVTEYRRTKASGTLSPAR